MEKNRNEQAVCKYWKLLRENEQKGIIGLYDLLWEEFYQYTSKIVGDAHAASDLVQEFFIHLWEKQASLPDNPMIRPYLYRALKNRILNYFQADQIKEGHIKAYSDAKDSIAEYTMDNVMERELYEIVLKEIDLLPVRMKEVYTLNFKEAMSTKEIAFTLGISEQTVRNQLNRANQRIRLSIKEIFIFIFLSSAVVIYLT